MHKNVNFILLYQECSMYKFSIQEHNNIICNEMSPQGIDVIPIFCSSHYNRKNTLQLITSINQLQVKYRSTLQAVCVHETRLLRLQLLPWGVFHTNNVFFFISNAYLLKEKCSFQSQINHTNHEFLLDIFQGFNVFLLSSFEDSAQRTTNEI